MCMGRFLKTSVQILSTPGETLALLKSGTSTYQDFTSAFYLCLYVYLPACLSLLPGALFIKLIILPFFFSFQFVGSYFKPCVDICFTYGILPSG